MNIFYLDPDPIACAEQHCDAHASKMCVEYAQLLSTAHRVVDGDYYIAVQPRDTVSNDTSIPMHS